MEYMYKCQKCNKEKTIDIKMSDYTSKIDCECGGKMDRLFTWINCNTHFNGSYNSTKNK